MLAQGQRDPAAYVELLATFPSAKDEILALLHATLGNQVVGAITAGARVDDAILVDGAPRPFDGTLAPGERGSAEAWNLQNIPNVVKFDHATHGKYAKRNGQLDADGVARFQRDHRMKPTGRVDDDTCAVAAGQKAPVPVPPPPIPSTMQIEAEFTTFAEYYDVALQGTSGQCDKPEQAEQLAREIADRCRLELKKRPAPPPLGFFGYLKNALQGTSSKYPDAGTAVKKALELADQAVGGEQKERVKQQAANGNSQVGKLAAEAAMQGFGEFYNAALQGVGGQFDNPEVAEQKARLIAELCQGVLERRAREKGGINDWRFVHFFMDAIQGAASKLADPAAVVKQAEAIAVQAIAGETKERDRVESLHGDSLNGQAEIRKLGVIHHLALQGTSGLFDKPEVADQKAWEIAERCEAALRRHADLRPDPTYSFDRNFLDALQGTAAKYTDPDVVIAKAIAIADEALGSGMKERQKLEREYADVESASSGT